MGESSLTREMHVSQLVSNRNRKAVEGHVAAIEDAVRAALRAQVEALTAYHPHGAPYVGGDASLPCHPSQCAGGMRAAVLALLAPPQRNT